MKEVVRSPAADPRDAQFRKNFANLIEPHIDSA
jgi:hypothetical protein